jgi:mannose/fructose-specific phosphotransferase system component IIA
MNDTPAVGVLLGHGAMAAGMVDAVRQITGCDEGALMPVSNHGKSPDALTNEVRELVGTGPAVLFTDLQSGSCAFTARRLTHGAPQLVVISGVNLPVLIDFVMNRSMPLAQLIPRLLLKGRAAIGCAPAHLEGHEPDAAAR